MLEKNKLSIIRHLSLFCALTLVSMPLVLNASCLPGQLQVLVLGSGGPELNDQRASTSYLVNIDGVARLLLDTGSGSSYNFERSGANFNSVQTVLFSHLHTDHSAELASYIKSAYFSGRETDLHIYGPEANNVMPSTEEFITLLFGKKGIYRYLYEYLDPNTDSTFKIKVHNIKAKKIFKKNLGDKLSIAAVSVHHGPIPALAWRINYGHCAITFSGDMNNQFGSLENLTKGSSILIAHNAIPEHAGEIARNLHMPPSEIGKIATQADVRNLVLSHRMQRTLSKEPEIKQLIAQYFKGSISFADDLSSFDAGISTTKESTK